MRKIAENSRALSEVQLDIVSGGMNVQINQISSAVDTSGASLGSGLLQKVVSLVLDSLKTAQRSHPQ
jgi:DUF4097 and DUF4098 domain-containing protein YvlB